MNLAALSYFLLINLGVAIFSWFKMRKETNATVEDYFLGKRSLGFVMVGGLLFLSNVNGVQFVGENESVYLNNMSVMAWGATSVLAMIIVAEFFMPRYLRSGVITTPDFLEDRYDSSTKWIVSIVFLLSYLINMLPSVLYGGAVVLNGIFHFTEFSPLSNWETLWLLVIGLAMVGGLYTILGGIRVVAMSDVVLGACLFVAGLCLPYFALKYLGHGDFQLGLQTILKTRTEHLNAIGRDTDAVPFSTLFTGMLLVNLYYWGMEQYIVQRALASRNLAESQKGIVLTALGKLISPLMLNIPGVVAVHLYPSLPNSAEVFPRLAGDVLPAALTGLIAAVIFGAAITSINAGLNSASTLFVLNIYKPLLQNQQKPYTDRQLIKIGKYFKGFATLVAIFIAPFIAFAQDGFYTWIQKVGGAFSIPIFTILLIGFITRRVPAIAAKIGLMFFVSTYLFTQTLWSTGLHFLHVLAILFLLTCALMLLIGKIWPQPMPYKIAERSTVSLAPWRLRHLFYLLLIMGLIGLYWLFSPWGVAT